MVLDSKINADDTGRLVSGTGIPADTFVGAVSDTGPISLLGNASTTGASNNYAKPWLGSFQLLNDSGQPVTLSAGFVRQHHVGRGRRSLDRGHRKLPEW